MVVPPFATELSKVLLDKLSDIKPADASKALEAVRDLAFKAAAPALLPKRLGMFGAGIVLGAGIGFLLAPNSGAETRAKLLGFVRSATGRMRGSRVASSSSESSSGTYIADENGVKQAATAFRTGGNGASA